MISFLFESGILYPVFGSALLSSFVIATLGGFATYNSLNYLSSSLTHATLGGIGLALFFSLPIIWTGQLFALVLGVGVFLYSRKNISRFDAYLDIVYAFGLSLGVFLISLNPSYQKNFSDFFFGTLILAGYPELLTLAGLSLIIVFYLIFHYHKLVAISFDSEFSQIAGINSRLHNIFLIAMLSVSLPLLVRVLGITATISLISVAPLIFERFFTSFIKIIIFSTIFNIFIFITAISASFYFDWQLGSIIGLFAACLFLFFLVINRLFIKFKKA